MGNSPPSNPSLDPVGESLPGWRCPGPPDREILSGRTCRLSPLKLESHASGLFEALIRKADPQLWTYLPTECPGSPADFLTWLEQRHADPTALLYVILEPTEGRPIGTTGYLRIDPANGVLEIGWVVFSPELQRTTAATEAVFLQLQHAFALGYRRIEWKCDTLNAPSRSAAQRFGFTFEGIFRQAVVTKKRNRDTAWYSLLDREWPTVRSAFERWLDPGNFDASGRQRLSLSDLTFKSIGPAEAATGSPDQRSITPE